MLTSKQQAVIKRGLDIVGAASLLVLTTPVIFSCALLVRVISPGPAFFRQSRPGRGGQPFALYKIRTMGTDSDLVFARLMRTDPCALKEWETYGRLAEDPRLIPRVGRLLRRTSIDELPQLVNVLRGDMSLVGPRPLPSAVVEGLPAMAIEARETVRPGLTGLWQVLGRSDLDLSQLLTLDEAYVANWSLALDVQILLRTPVAVVCRRGAY